MVFKLIESGQRSWRRLDGTDLLPKVIYGVKFKDGIEQGEPSLDPQANP
jgi:putative transposase